MKTTFKLSIISASLIALSSHVMAAVPTNAELQKEIRLLMRHDKQLRAQVKSLKAQLNTTKSHDHHVVRTAKVPIALRTTRRSAHVLIDRFDHPVTVTTAPIVGENKAGNPADTLEQLSKINLSLTILKQRAKLMRYLTKNGLSLSRPIVEIGGALEGQLYGIDGFGRGSNPNGINLTTAEFDVAAALGPWVGGFMALDYDNSPISSGNRSPKATVYLNRGFATIGNLNVFPLYASIGEMYTPFGRYSGLQLTTPLTQSLARTRTPAFVGGFSLKGGLYGSVYGYSGSQTSGHEAVFKQGGVDLGYHYTFGKTQQNYIDASADFETNLADSQGLQATGGASNQFQGFGVATNGNALAHRVPAADAALKVGVGNWWGIAEFISAVRSFSSGDLSYGNTGATLKGATPKAAHLELNYTIHVRNKPVTFGAVYGRTWQALAANLPEVSYTADIQASIWRYTLETIEYRHDVDYGANKSAAGTGSSALAGTGKTRNTYMAQLGVYF